MQADGLCFELHCADAKTFSVIDIKALANVFAIMRDLQSEVEIRRRNRTICCTVYANIKAIRRSGKMMATCRRFSKPVKVSNKRRCLNLETISGYTFFNALHEIIFKNALVCDVRQQCSRPPIAQGKYN